MSDELWFFDGPPFKAVTKFGPATDSELAEFATECPDAPLESMTTTQLYAVRHNRRVRAEREWRLKSGHRCQGCARCGPPRPLMSVNGTK